MELKNFTYLFVILGLFALPLLFILKKEVKYFTKLKYLLPAIIFTGIIFIIWDLRFEKLGIWGFNPEYIIGFYILNLPFEEWLFFFIAPLCCVFIYEILKIKLPGIEIPNIFLAVSLVLLVIFALLAYFARDKLYTFFTFFLLTIYFGYTVFRNRFKKYYTKFYLTYLISLVPFLISNIILTTLPVVEYNDQYTLGMEFLNMPVENFGYFFLLLLMNITIYEYLRAHFL